MISLPDTLPNDPDQLKHLLMQMHSRVSQLQEENTLLRQRLFGRKSEQSTDPNSPQLGMFNEAESPSIETPSKDDE